MRASMIFLIYGNRMSHLDSDGKRGTSHDGALMRQMTTRRQRVGGKRQTPLHGPAVTSNRAAVVRLQLERFAETISADAPQPIFSVLRDAIRKSSPGALGPWPRRGTLSRWRGCSRRGAGARRWSRCGCGRRRRGRRCCRCGCWAATAWRLNLHLHGRAGLEEAYRGVGALRRLIGVETEVIQCAKSNGVGVLVLGKGLARPGNGTVPGLIIVAPRRAAVTRGPLGAIMRKSGVLRRSMETDVAEGDSGTQWHGERLNRAIQVHVVERVFVVPHPGGGIGYLVADEPQTVIARIGLELGHGGPCPGHDGRLLT